MPVSNEIVTFKSSATIGNSTVDFDWSNYESGIVTLSCTTLNATTLDVSLTWADPYGAGVTLLTFTQLTGTGSETLELPEVVPMGSQFVFEHSGGTNTSVCSLTGILRKNY